jgi:hypothetical protein
MNFSTVGEKKIKGQKLKWIILYLWVDFFFYIKRLLEILFFFDNKLFEILETYFRVN